MPTLQFFPFGPGLHEENENLLQNAGVPRAIENFVRTKNGRLEARKDYETIANTGTGSQPSGTGALDNLRLYDLAEYSGRLLGFGRADFSAMRAHATDATEQVFELLERPTGNWRRAPTAELPAGTQARMVGRIGRKPNAVLTLDIAAGGGLVCMVFDAQVGLPSSATVTVGVHLFDPATDETVFMAGISDAERARVVCINGVFFVAHVVTSTNAIALYRFNPASDTALVPLTNPVAAGGVIRAWDMSPGHDTATFWIAAARTGPTNPIRGLNSAGTVTYSAAGPVVLYDGISILNQTTSGTNRTHVAGVVPGTLAVDLYTYLPPSTVPAVTSLALAGMDATTQVGLSMDPDAGTAGTTMYVTVRSLALVTDPIFSRGTNVTSHAAFGSINMSFAELNSKTAVVNNRFLVGALVQEEVGFYTHMLLRQSDVTLPSSAFRPVCVFDRFLGHQLTPYHLPQIAHDTSTNLTYMVVSTEDTDRRGAPQVLEVKIAGTDRRQTAQLGDVLYIAGSVVMAFDGRIAQEAGGFLSRPLITNMNQSGSAGALDLLGTYQSILVAEFRDAKNRRIQSAPSNLRQLTLTGAFDEILVTAITPITFRDMSFVADVVTPQELQSAPTMAIYRTLNANNGNGTFHIDNSVPLPFLADHGRVLSTLTQSDVDLSDNEILYTQGARGALSGPLEFVCPDASGSLCASADRLLTGQLINDTQIQESRPLFPGEQAQWNDTPGFFRDVRNRVLAVARLDERRILFTATEIFECDGPGVDDNGLGDLGAPRRLPSDVGLYGGVLGWRSMVEMSAGIMFQGLANQIYLLPRGGVTPVPIGDQVEDTLALFPVITAAVYMNEDRTVRFCCQNSETAPTASIVLLFDVRFGEWFVEGPYAFGIRSAAKAAGRFYLLTSANVVLRQRTQDLPLVFVNRAWRGSWQHPHKPGMFGRVEAFWCYTIYHGNSRLRAVVYFDDGATETHPWFDVVGLADGDQVRKRFQFDQQKCESFRVDFEQESFQGQATRGLDFIYWAVESEPADVPNEVGPEDMT